MSSPEVDQTQSPRQPTRKTIALGAVAVVVLGVGAVSSGVFDSAPTGSQMCTDKRVVEIVRKLINEETPNIGQLGGMLHDLDVARTGGARDLLGEKQKLLRETKEYYVRNPVDPNDHSMGDQNAERAKRIATLEGEIAELRAKEEPRRRALEQMKGAKNEIVVVDGPTSIELDRTLGRASCRLAYKVNGLGYDNPGVQMSAPATAVYTVQPDGRDWLINLLSSD